ncbi:MAG: RNA polymerase sigma factor [Phycisphaerales bacterium]|nr:MAG: RNA polymerase sigma factor [Phycisphaerales bacterium]
MINPFVKDTRSDKEDRDLIRESLKGNRGSLEHLIARHQAWIYNIAFRMVLVAEDAEDITQEILIKMITKLPTYDPARASFRTWLHRIVANHVVNMRKRGYEGAITRLDRYYSFVETIPDRQIASTPENDLVIQDVMIGCVLGALLCLDRQQRLVFILGVVFNVSSQQGGEIVGISGANFRKILSRARAKLFNFMNGRCGMVNENAPCKCRNKVSEFIKQGWHTIDNMNFYRENVLEVDKLISQRIARFDDTIYRDFTKLYRDHPFYESPDLTEWLNRIVDRPDFKEIFDMN